MITDLVTAAPDSVEGAAPDRRVVTVYTTGRSCIQCTLTETVLRELGIPFVECDITLGENASARDYVVEELGYTQAPVVVVDDHDHWSGFQPDQVKRLVKRAILASDAT